MDLTTILHRRLPPGRSERRARRAWALGWLGAAVIGVANGVAREVLYERRLGERTAHQVSTGTAVAALAAYVAVLDRRWPLRSARAAATTGAAWAAATVAFELAFGTAVDRKSPSELLADYDLRKGRLWPVVPLTLGAGPAIARELRLRAG